MTTERYRSEASLALAEHKERIVRELLVRDMDLDMIEQVRQTWQFYRDRRPDAYADLVRP